MLGGLPECHPVNGLAVSKYVLKFSEAPFLLLYYC